MPPRVLMLSHAFHDPENRKNIVALAERCDAIVVATPAVWDLPPEDRDFKLNDFFASDYAAELFMPLRMIRLVPGERVTHYALRSFSFDLRRRRRDLIHIDYEPWSPVFWQALIARRLFAPRAAVVFSPKKNTYRDHPGLLGWLKRRIAEAGLRRVTLLMPASEMTRQLYERTFRDIPESPVVTHLAVDTESFRPPPDRDAAGRDEVVVGFSGRFDEQKGLLDLLAAVEAAITDGEKIRLRLLGSGPLSPELEERGRKSEWLELLPPVGVGEVAEVMHGLDIFVLPARVEPDHEEHDGHALLQALACGLPVIGTRSGIIPELIDDRTGVQVDAGDAEALRRAITELAGDPERRRALGEAGRRRAVERYSLEAVTDAKFAAYTRARELAA